jgi:hypothetical protein
MSAFIDRKRLAAVLGMLGSAHGGEVMNAARQAERIRHEAGATWHEIIIVMPPPAFVAPDLDDIEDDDVSAELATCLARLDLLAAWEVQFVRSISHRRHRLSPKQKAVLARLFAKVLRRQ